MSDLNIGASEQEMYKMDMLDMAADDHQEWVDMMEAEFGDADPEDDCPLDGDAESALASCGWGTDEDYGSYEGDPYEC